MNIRTISAAEISKEVERLFCRANRVLPEDAEELIKKASQNEKESVLARDVLCTLCENLNAARENDLPICQDTGMAVLFAEIGQDVHIDGDFEEAVNEGVKRAYVGSLMRCSVVKDPLFDRSNTQDNRPAVIHTRLVKGDRIRLVAAPKGFGSENMSALKMFTPTSSREDIIDFVLEIVKRAGSNPCPPITVGIGIGGTFEKAAQLAKKALTRNVSDVNKDGNYRALEREILERINKLGIGPQGFGGICTALAVKIEHYPTHIAGLPVAVNINCHVTRHAEAVI